MASPFASRTARIRRSARGQQSSRQSRNGKREGQIPRHPLRGRDGTVLERVTWEITKEPIPEPRIERLSEAERDAIDDLAAKTQEGRATIEECQELVARHPDIPRLYNYLNVAYERAGMQDKAVECAEETYRRFPDYLFGMTSYATYLLRENRIDEVTALLNRRHSLHLWITDRRRYHISEFVSFNALMVRYFAVTDDLEIAERYLKMMKEVAPDHPATTELTDRLEGLRPMVELKKMIDRWRGK